MQSLLRWSIENSVPLNDTQQPPAQRKDLDPGIIDMILGRPDAELMKEDMAVATDVSLSEDVRVSALDHLEMLIEQIDNANNLQQLKLWEPLHSLLTSQLSTSPIITQALWVIGTAVQNNPAAQDSYMIYKPLSTLFSFLTPSQRSNLQVRSKAIYTLSGLLKHNSPAVEALDSADVDGWTKLRDAIEDSEIAVRRKTIFLLSALLIPTENQASPSTVSSGQEQIIHPNSHAANLFNAERTSTSALTLAALSSHNILNTVIKSLVNPLPYGEDGAVDSPDADFEEKAIRLLYTYLVSCRGPISSEEKQSLRTYLAKGHDENWGLTGQELKELESAVKDTQ